MSNIKRRKLGFYYLTTTNENITIIDALTATLNVINDKDNASRKINILGPKFGFLDTINSYQENSRHQLIFKSATHSYRPNLLDSISVEERNNPKNIGEGEIHKTHLICKAISGDVIVVLEKFLASFSIKQIVSYLNKFASLLDFDEPVAFGFEAIVKDNFLEEMNTLSRVTCADIYVDKQLLGSDVLDYSNRIHQVQHEVMISVKANVKESIAEFTKETFAKLGGNSYAIRRMRVKGRNAENNEVKINTDFIEKQEFVTAHIDESTGEVISTEILNEIESILYNY